jgi:hypothetical protein
MRQVGYLPEYSDKLLVRCAPLFFITIKPFYENKCVTWVSIDLLDKHICINLWIFSVVWQNTNRLSSVETAVASVM